MKRFTVAASILALTVAAVPAAAADDVMSPAAGIAAAGLAAADVELSLPTINYSRGAVLPTLYVSLAGLQAYDVYATTTGLRRGAVEANGVMKNVAGNPAAMWAVKAGVTTATIVIAEQLWKQHRRTAAIVTMIASNGLMAVVAARNASVLRAQR